ncbi:hypothetical protein [Clostridium sp. JS66]|uniref:hypothetical protein n=1 Tax=Clostridium sp. JS66 TaxID=3064705 RepID=UPI00298D9212|nr:hypothetical protein [Clostridium sp. JS66]WPC42807.1 hypothetical protein Q6H37_04880 [Clostridium sp. JS66]
MENNKIEDIDNNVKLSFGKMVQRERIKLDKSLKDVEKDLTKKEKIIQDGKEVEIDKPQITASYLNRIENEGRNNLSLYMVYLLMKEFNLDVYEVFKSFGYDDVLPQNNKFESIERMIRINDFEAPVRLGNKEYNKPLTSMQTEILISIIRNVFEFGTTNEENTMYVVKKLLSDLDDYRKSRRKLADSLIDDTTK